MTRISISFGSGSSEKTKSRDQKGKSLLSIPSDYTVFDLETTGLDPTYDSIIEIGAIKYRNDTEIDRFSSLVNPRFPIDDFITDLTGITNDMLVRSPSIDTVLPAFLEFAGNDIMVGHNVNFDVNFIYDACKRDGLHPFSNDFVDTLRLAKRLFPDCHRYKLCVVAEYLKVLQSDAHRAIADAETTNACLQAMKDHMERNAVWLPSSNDYGCSHRDIHRTSDDFIDVNSPIYQKTCVFTGTLEKLSRAEAMQIVMNVGGECADSVSRKTDYLIIGRYNYQYLATYGKSTKQKKAEQLMLNGGDIQIISEEAFYDMITEYLSQQHVDEC